MLSVTRRAQLLTLALRRETLVHEAADRHTRKIAVVARYAFAAGRRALGDPPSAERAAHAVQSALVELLPSALLAALRAGGVAAAVPSLAAAQMRAAAPRLTFTFDAKNEAAARWARRHAARLAKDVSDETRRAVRDAVADAHEGDSTLRESRDKIRAAVGDDARADRIARTEAMSAANEGQRSAWRQAVDEGLLPDDARRVWIATSGACPLCDDLDGVETDLSGEYPDGGDGPPLHPNCRCTEGVA